jgi:hypothetical protein
MNRTELLTRLNSRKGKIFSIQFIKRSNGELRKMTARLGVKKNIVGTGSPFSVESANLITVYSMADKGYRNIPVEGILEIKGA